MTAPTTMPDIDCESCGIRAESRTCEDCGLTMTITDCGHYRQPRPIAASAYSTHDYTCADCERRRAKQAEDGPVDDSWDGGFAPNH